MQTLPSNCSIVVSKPVEHSCQTFESFWIEWILKKRMYHFLYTSLCCSLARYYKRFVNLLQEYEKVSGLHIIQVYIVYIGIMHERDFREKFINQRWPCDSSARYSSYSRNQSVVGLAHSAAAAQSSCLGRTRSSQSCRLSSSSLDSEARLHLAATSRQATLVKAALMAKISIYQSMFSEI